MQNDSRDAARIKRSLEFTRDLYDHFGYPKIDTTDLTVEQTVDEIMKLINIEGK